jgi:hypothetical protein
MLVRFNQNNSVGSVQQVAQQLFDNEAKYFWDVSIALPVHQLKQIEYVVDKDKPLPTIASRKIERQKILALY